MKTADTIRQDIHTLELAIEDSQNRVESNPTDEFYVHQQQTKQRYWGVMVDQLKADLKQIEQEGNQK